MKGRILFFALLLSLIFLSAGAIYANDVDGDLADSFNDGIAVYNVDSINESTGDLPSINNAQDELKDTVTDNLVKVSSQSISDNSDNDLVNNKFIDIDNAIDGMKNPISEASVDNVSSIISDDLIKYYHNDSQFEVTFVDENGNPLINSSISFIINGVTYNRVTNDQGVAIFSINLNPGIYNITSINNVTGETVINTVTVLPTLINHADIIKYYKNETHYQITILDGNGNPLANTDVSFNINGVFYTRTTDENGVATLRINLNPGTYIITAIGPDGYMVSNNVTVLPTIVSNEDVVKGYKDSHDYTATFLDDNGNPLANTDVSFNINGVFYTRTTDENGVATLRINLNPGTYILTALNPKGLMVSNTITVLNGLKTYLNVSDMVILKDEKGVLTATLYNELGNTIRDHTVVLTVDGKSYKLTTDNEGKIYFDINLDVGQYEVDYVVDGSYYYEDSTNSSYIEILSDWPVDIAIGDNIIIYNKNGSFEVYVTDDKNNPLQNITVHLVINGVDYYRVTDENGVARLNINLLPGVYSISYNVEQEGYEQASGSTYISVINTNQPTISADDIVIHKGEEGKYSVTLTADGVPIVGKEIIFEIAGKTYTAITNEEGIATILVNLTQGSYDVLVSFNGSSKLNSASATGKISFDNTVGTIIKDIGKLEFVYGSDSAFYIILTDVNGNPIANADVIISVSGIDYYRTTDENGRASLNINLEVGSYIIAYKFEGTADYAPSSGSANINVIKSDEINGNGYWVQGKDMYDVDLSALASQGVGNIFLNFFAFSLYGESRVLEWIQQANDLNIKVHIWMQSFYDGGWISPTLDDGTPNYDFFEKKIAEAVKYATLQGVSGIHLDYLRVPGNAYKNPGTVEAINEFVTLISNAVREVNPNIILSAALMPEKEIDYYYGQDITHIGKYMDVIVPMIYKGNYNAGSSWISSMTKWFVDNSQGAQVWVGLQGYESDSNVSPLPLDELTNDAQSAISAGAVGVLIFRWGTTNFVDFTSLDYNGGDIPPVTTTVRLEDIKDAATNLKKYIEENGVMPNYVTVGDVKFSIPQFLYLMAQAVININSSVSSDIGSINVSAPDSNTGDVIYGQINLNDFLAMAQSIIDACNQANKAPNSITSPIGDVKYETLIYMFSKIVSYVDTNNRLPEMVYTANLLDNFTLTVTMLPSVSSPDYQYVYYTTTWLNYCPHCGYYGSLLINPKGTVEGELTCDYCGADYCGVTGYEKLPTSGQLLTRLSDSIPVSPGSVGDNVTIEQILNASVYVKGYIEANGVLPEYVSINDREYTIYQYLYLAAVAMGMINSNNFTNVTVVDVSKAPNPDGDYLNSNLNITEYLDVASRVVSFILANGYAPNYASSDLGKISFDKLVDAFSRILAFYVDNGRLPSTVSINQAGSSQTIIDLAHSLTDGLNSTWDIANALFIYVRDHISYESYFDTMKGAEGTLLSGGGNCCDQAWLLVELARAVDLTIRFVHADCYFVSSGSLIGHVWTEILIDGEWVVADTTSSRNSLGVIKNWDTSSYQLKGIYDILPF